MFEAGIAEIRLCGRSSLARVVEIGILARQMRNIQSPNALTRRVAVIKALAHPSRLAIAGALQQGERCVQDLTELVGADMSTVSKHLTIMRDAGLLEMEKRGLNVFYKLRCPCLPGFFECVDSLVPDRPKRSSAKVNRARP